MSAAHAAAPQSGTMPQTGAAYLASLDDGRVVVHDGERVDRVAEHAAFAPLAHTIARLYDTLHEPEVIGGHGPEALLAPTENGAGRTHAFYGIPRSRDDLRVQREAIRAWQRRTCGFVGRTPEYLACMLTSIGANAAFFGRFEQQARTVLTDAQRDVTHYAQALVNPPVDRDLPPDEVEDVFVHVVRETDEGVVIRGAKAVVTGAATAQRLFVSHFGGDVSTDAFAIACTVPVGADGVSIHTRGTPVRDDQPFATRFAENDALVVFDDVLVPWRDVLIRDADTMRAFNQGAVGWNARLAFQAATRLEAKLEAIIALAARGTEIMGTNGLRGVEAGLGELVAFRHTVAGLRDAMIEQATPSGDSVLPGVESAMAFSALAPDAYSRMRVVVETMLSSALAHVPTSTASLATPEGARIAPLLRGSGGADATERLAVLGALWDAIGTGFGARHELYERSYWGQPDRTHIGAWKLATATGAAAAWSERVRPFVD